MILFLLLMITRLNRIAIDYCPFITQLGVSYPNESILRPYYN